MESQESLYQIEIQSFYHIFGGVEISVTKLIFSTTCHPQTNGQTEVTNQTCTTLLWDMVSKSLRDWDAKLPYAKFASNRFPSYAPSHSPFKECYGLIPLTPLNLVPIP